jgi:hypothetical protein
VTAGTSLFPCSATSCGTATRRPESRISLQCAPETKPSCSRCVPQIGSKGCTGVPIVMAQGYHPGARPRIPSPQCTPASPSHPGLKVHGSSTQNSPVQHGAESIATFVKKSENYMIQKMSNHVHLSGAGGRHRSKSHSRAHTAHANAMSIQQSLMQTNAMMAQMMAQRAAISSHMLCQKGPHVRAASCYSNRTCSVLSRSKISKHTPRIFLTVVTS